MSVDSNSEEYRSFSPYGYVLNNPLKLIDPDGRNSRDFNNFVSKEKISEAAEHNSKILTPTVEQRRINDLGPTILDMMSLGFLLTGPAGAPFSVGASSLSVYWTANKEDHSRDAIVSATTDLIGIMTKNPKTAIAVAAIQVAYDVALAGKDPKGNNTTNMFSADNTRVDNSVQKSLLGLTGSKSPKELWDEMHRDYENNKCYIEDSDENTD